MKIYFLIFFSMVVSFACSTGGDAVDSENSTGSDSPIVPENKTGLSYLALGDSYTIGQSVTEAERFPVILANDLSSQNIKVLKPDIIAVTGWTTGDLLNSLATYKPNKVYDMVSLLIGVNNQYQGQSQDTYRKEFRQLLLKSTELAGGKKAKVFVLSIPDWGASKYGASYNRKQISLEIDQFNAIASEECAKESILFINITDISRRALDDPSLLASDGLHFSGKMHQLWVDSLISQIKRKLQ
jgi:lysophospholipase L1-like esterase